MSYFKLLDKWSKQKSKWKGFTDWLETLKKTNMGNIGKVLFELKIQTFIYIIDI